MSSQKQKVNKTENLQENLEANLDGACISISGELAEALKHQDVSSDLCFTKTENQYLLLPCTASQ